MPSGVNRTEFHAEGIEDSMFGLTRLRIVEIGVALLLTLAALIFVGLTVWADETELTDDGAGEARASASSAGIGR
jgi:hypothetical protein